MGRPHGLAGWLFCDLYTESIESAIKYAPWHFTVNSNTPPQQPTAWRTHNKRVIVKLPTCTDRDSAALLTLQEIWVPESRLPKLTKNQNYLFEFIGLEVYNVEEHHLGTIESVFNANNCDNITLNSNNKRYSLPLLESLIKQVDISKGKLILDWPEVID